VLATTTPSTAHELAEGETHPSSDGAAQREPESLSGGWYGSTGLGFASFVIDQRRSNADSTDNFGLALQTRGGPRFGQHFGLNFGFTWAFTEFDRTADFWDAGYDIGKWTTGAHRTVHRWSKRGTDESRGPRALGAFFAHFGLLFPYMIAGMAYVLGPFAASTYAEFDLTASFHFGSEAVDAYVELGPGLIGFIHPEDPVLLGGYGPVGGGGLNLGALHLGAQVLWTPPGWHGEADRGDFDAYAATFVLGFGG